MLRFDGFHGVVGLPAAPRGPRESGLLQWAGSAYRRYSSVGGTKTNMRGRIKTAPRLPSTLVSILPTLPCCRVRLVSFLEYAH